MTIDELVVTLNLDPKGFNEGQKAALESFIKSQNEIDKRLKNLEARNKAAAHSFGDMTNAAEGLFTVLAGTGMAAFARDTMNSAAATGRMATNAGVATAEMSAFGLMIERVGGNSEAAQANLVALQGTLQRAKWGDVSPDFLLGLSQVGGSLEDSPVALAFKLSQFANTHSAQETNLTASRLGLSQDVANEMIKGSTQALKDFKDASDAALSPEQKEKLTAMQAAWRTMDQQLTSVGRDVETSVAPALTDIMNTISEFTKNNRAFSDSLAGILVALTALGSLKPAAWLLRLLGLGAVPEVLGTALATGVAVVGAPLLGVGIAMTPTTANAGEKNIYENGKMTEYGKTLTGGGSASGGGRASAADRESWIRNTAAALGMDPNVAVAVARSEGFKSFSGDQGTSFGDFQLHVTPDGRGHAVGDEFRKQTGLDPSDPANEQKADQFALEWAKKHGWGDFHGAARAGIDQFQGITIENMTINAPSADPKQMGHAAADAMNSRFAASIANNANTGQRPQ